MEPDQQQILDSVFAEIAPPRRRTLLPWWIKTFCWIFMVLSAIGVAICLAGLFGVRAQLALYGMETYEPLSVTGLIIVAIFLFKGLTAFALWTEKDHAITLGEIDAFTGIAVCSFVMFYPLFDDQSGFRFSFRLELVLLIFYLIQLRSIKSAWRRSQPVEN